MTRFAFALIVALLTVATVQGQEYPVRPVRVVVGFPPGGSVDIAARVIGQKLAEQLGQPFVIENRPGAIGTLAMNAVAGTVADGYTLLLGTNPQIRPGVTAETDPYRSFEPIALTNVIPVVLLAHPALPAADLNELLQRARAADPQRPLTFSTPGRGSPMELAMETLKVNARVDLLHVPYNGGPAAVNDAMSGQVQMVAVGLPTALGQVRAGKLKPLAVLQESRTDLLPGTPTAREAANVSGIDFLVWLGLFAPARTPPAVVRRLESETARALADRDVRAKLSAAALDVRFASGEKLGELVRAQLRASLEAMQRFGIKTE